MKLGKVSIPKRVHRLFSHPTQTATQAVAATFQSLSGFIGFSALLFHPQSDGIPHVSIPKRVHRLFSHTGRHVSNCCDPPFVSIPKRVHRLFSRTITCQYQLVLAVSIPKRVHRLFSRGTRNFACEIGHVSIPKRVHRLFSLAIGLTISSTG